MSTLNHLISTLLLFSYGLIIPWHSSEKMNQKKDSIPTKELVSQKSPFFEKIYFSKSDAEKILGEKVQSADSSSTVKKDTLEIKSAYHSNSKDQKRGKTGSVYFMIEEYSSLSSATNAYRNIKTANKHHDGIKTLRDIGDEAYFHTDKKNFYFILVRKQKIMFRMKVNKITSHTSLDEFNLISKKIAANLP